MTQNNDEEIFFYRFHNELERIKDNWDLSTKSKALILWYARNILNFEDEEEIIENICDGPNDEGIDAILFDQAEKIVYFLSASISDKFENTKRNLPENDLKNTFEGFRLVTNGDYRGKVNPVLEDLAKEYDELINSGEFSEVQIIFLTERHPPASTKYVDNFNKEFPSVRVKFVDFENLRQLYEKFLSSTESPPEKVLLEVIGKTLTYDEEYKSAIFTISGKSLAQVFITYGTAIFQRNVRYFIPMKGKKAINSQIKDTASDPDKSRYFWYFNNGITIVCSKMDIPPNGKVVILRKMQIINGAQTTYSIYKAFMDNTLKESTRVLVKVIESTDDEFIDEVTLFTNSQNPINLRDLCSRDTIQTKIQKLIRNYGYFYERKRGEFNALYPTHEIKVNEFGNNWKRKVISNEKAAQAYLAFMLNKPSQAKAQKGKIFLKSEGGFYYDIFNDSLMPERILLAFKLLEYIEMKRKEYQETLSNAGEMSENERNNTYSYDYIIHSDLFILSLFNDFLRHKNHNFDVNDCVKLMDDIDTGVSEIQEIYSEIVDSVRDFILAKKNSDPDYYHAKFFKNESSMGQIRSYLKNEKGFNFISVD